MFDFNDTLIMYEDNPANKKFPVFINANDEMIDKSKYLITEDDKPLKIDEMGFIFDNIKNNNGDITLQKMSVEKINKKSIQYNLESDMVDTTQQMLKDIQKNSNNIIIILSDSFQKFIRLYFNYKLSELKIDPVFILGAIDRDEIKKPPEVWATKKANALKEISKTKSEANIFFYDSEEININKANELKNPKIKSFRLEHYDKSINELYEESKKP